MLSKTSTGSLFSLFPLAWSMKHLHTLTDKGQFKLGPPQLVSSALVVLQNFRRGIQCVFPSIYPMTELLFICSCSAVVRWNNLKSISEPWPKFLLLICRWHHWNSFFAITFIPSLLFGYLILSAARRPNIRGFCQHKLISCVLQGSVSF